MTPRKTPFSTSPEQAASERAALDETIELLTAADEEHLPVERLSDLGRAAAGRLRERWTELTLSRRARAVQQMVVDAENSVERHYERALLVAFDDPDPEVRRRALDGLWLHESDAFLTRLLDEVVHESDAGLRAAEVDALGSYAALVELEELDAALVERLTATLKRLLADDPDAAVRRMALESIAYITGDDEIVAAIERAFAAGDSESRVSALRAMGRQAVDHWLPAVGGEFANPDPEVRFDAARAAGGIGDQRLVPALVDLVDDEDVEVQMAAIAALGAIGGRLATNTLRRLSKGDRPAIVEAAQEALEDAALVSGQLTPRV